LKNLSEIQIDGEALLHNLEALTRISPTGIRRAVVVKGNAYGHGLAEVVQALDGHVDYFQVDDFDELALLRQATQCPALVLGYVQEAQIVAALALDAEIAIYDAGRLATVDAAAKKLGKKARVHLKIDALLGRQGVLPSELAPFLDELRRYPNIELVAAYSHFANIEDTTDLTHAHAQSEAFTKCHAAIQAAGWPELGRHESATSGAMVYEGEASDNNLVRLGVGVYGLYPSSALERSHSHLALRPAMRWVSHLAQVKTLPAMHPVGYGLTYITASEQTIGIVPQGYSDGYDRGLSSSGQVLVQGKRCPVLGRVAMNMFAIDLTNVPDAKAEDEVVLLGDQGDAIITAEEIALRIGTINYEVTTRVSPLLPRVVV